MIGKNAWRVGRKFKQSRFLVKLFWDSLSGYQGNCKGVGRSVPIVTSAVPISPVQLISMNSRGGGGNERGPRGAQYCPVLLISSFSVHSIKLFAASSGVTAISHYQHSPLFPLVIQFQPPNQNPRKRREDSPPPSSQNLSNPTPFVISVLIKPGCTIPTTTP